MLKRLLRFAVGFLFILSGGVKAVDIRGFVFKLEEYFSAQVFDLPFLEVWALPIAAIVVMLEIALGLMLLLDIRLKWTLRYLIILCLFFAFLTFYSAYYHVVTDCGCFGDAIKLSPWQSFWKDIILLALLILIGWLYRHQFSTKAQSYRYSFLALGLISGLWLMIYGWRYEPAIDFRDYKIGTDLLSEKQKIAAHPSEYKTVYTLKNKKNKTEITVNQDEYINQNYWQNPDWEIQEDQTTNQLVKQGYVSEIVKFKIENQQGEDVTDSLLTVPKAVLVFSYQPDHADAQLLADVEEKVAQLKKITVYGISTNPQTFKILPNGLMDGTAIKAIARSNPFVLVLKRGKIVDKMPARDFINQ